MTRILKTSGFLGLATMMTIGLYQNMLLASGQGVPGWLVGGHAHMGVLSILAVVLGFAVPALGVTGRLRSAVTGLFVAGQWLLPVTIWVGEGAGVTMLIPTSFLWGLCLLVSMLLMAYVAATGDHDRGGRLGSASPADD
ncbi:hypothetical protein [Halorarum halobium]|uniref:hypothetical protein n=1 Tax=Halorarum halobium TaxID=3075121 RepID=UPI0028A6B9F6|nr:hypothetical protein [Halobaculum sp. XH14]